MKAPIQQYANLKKLSIAAAGHIARIAEQCVNERGYFTLALSGGSTPRTLHEYLTALPYSANISWMETHLFWGDERFVPADHPDSNFLMALHTLIDHVPVPAENVHRIPTELPTPEQAAKQYETTLREKMEVFDLSSRSQRVPVFDCLLLGMGPDGHTASLFPGSPVLAEQTRWVAATPLPNLNPPVRRITLTFPVINAAKHVFFLVAGAEKQEIVQTIQDEPDNAREQYPAARVNPVSGELLWFVC